jgi:hypothetical protein
MSTPRSKIGDPSIFLPLAINSRSVIPLALRNEGSGDSRVFAFFAKRDSCVPEASARRRRELQSRDLSSDFLMLSGTAQPYFLLIPKYTTVTGDLGVLHDP